MDLAFRALADPSRRSIIALLAERPHTVNELLEHFDFSQPALSKHLRVLRGAHLVVVEVEGRFRRYRIDGDVLGDMVHWLLHYRRFWTGRLDVLGEVLKREATRGKAQR